MARGFKRGNPLVKGSFGFYIDFEVPYINIRNELGHFADAQRQLYDQNRDMAYALQTQVARVIDSNIIRKKVKTNRLVRATLDEQNAIWGREFVGVGNPEYLDKSIAKYWRTIEEGSAKTWTKRSFLSLSLQGLWGLNTYEWRTSAAGNEWAALGGKHQSGGKAASPGGRRGAFGRAGQEMYHPFRYGKGANLPVFHPTKQIDPMHAYKYVAENPNSTRMAVDAGREFIERIMNRGVTPVGPTPERSFRGGAYNPQ